ncbi:MAG: hypothetical protein L0229_31345 [Blastocatellia bacterium]|nr:hypothetical protein [Blastocatellia bacterium]
MDKEFRTYMEAIGAEFEEKSLPFESASDDHPAQEELIDYQRGWLEESRHKEVQSHIVVCGECLAALENISDFFGPVPEDAESIDDLEVRRQWKTFLRRIEDERQPLPGARKERPVTRLFSSRAALALAASLLLVAGLALLWAILLRQENQELADRLRAQEKDSTTQLENLERENRQLQERTSTLEQNAQRADELERENRRLQEREDALRDDLQTEIARLREPEVNAPIFDIFSREFIRRSGSEEGMNRIKVSPAAQSIVLILSGEGQTDATGYLIELVDRSGRRLWRSAKLKRDGQGNFVIRLNRELLGKGEYRLKLYGQEKDGSKMLSEYPVVVE